MSQTSQTIDDWMKWIIGGSIGLMIVGIGAFVAIESQSALKPKTVTQKDQAKTVRDQGRNHIEDIGGQTYASNPPTSGNHFASWLRRGVYEQVLSDGYLIHSLEHGYVVISYNCGEKTNEKDTISYKSGDPLTKLKANANGQMSPLKPETLPAAEVQLPAIFSSNECKQLVENLSQFLKEYHRIVIVPRVRLDTQIALTAWNKIDKMDTFNEERIRAFIATYHNKGPEQTVE